MFVTPSVRRVALCTTAALPLVLLLAAVLGTAPAASAACGSAGYTYAGLQTAAGSAGMNARITVAAMPHVQSGHVAAWVGVGGPHEGPRGTDEWIQVGFSAFPGSTDDDVYYEVARPNQSPRYTLVETGVAVGETRDFAVRETAPHGVWRVWVDGKPVSPAIWLPDSAGRFRPVATTESWGAGRSVCNGFAYRFAGIGVAARGAGWTSLGSTYAITSGGYRFVRISRTAFFAGSEPKS